MSTPVNNTKPLAIETVLVLDGDVLVRMPIAQYLRDCGYRVLEATSVDEAMTILPRATKCDNRRRCATSAWARC